MLESLSVRQRKPALPCRLVFRAGLGLAASVAGCASEETAHTSDKGAAMGFYDDAAHYNAVKDLWFGLGDYATDQPGR